MKGLTLTQPWATLVANGAKRIETRSWGTAYRGPLLIHAAKGFPVDARDLVSDPLWRRHLRVDSWRDLPVGAAIATARLTGCVSTNDSRIRARFQFTDYENHTPRTPDQLDAEFGNFGPDRFAWFLEDVKPLATPIPMKGALQLWPVLPEYLAQIGAAA